MNDEEMVTPDRVMDAMMHRPDLITDGQGIGSVTVMVAGRARHVIVADDHIPQLARRFAAHDHAHRLADVLDPMPLTGVSDDRRSDAGHPPWGVAVDLERDGLGRMR